MTQIANYAARSLLLSVLWKERKLLDFLVVNTLNYTKQYWLQIVPLDIKGDKGINDFENWLYQRSGIIVIPNILPKNWFKDKFCFFHTQHNIASNERGGLLFISAGLSNILPYLSYHFTTINLYSRHDVYKRNKIFITFKYIR